MENGKATVKVGKRTIPVALPDFATREELAIGWHEAAKRGDGLGLRRVAAAALGLCTAIGRQSRQDYAASKCDPLAYGGGVYGWLREQKVETANIVEAGGECVRLCAEALFPRAPEVAEKADFFGDGESPTS